MFYISYLELLCRDFQFRNSFLQALKNGEFAGIFNLILTSQIIGCNPSIIEAFHSKKHFRWVSVKLLKLGIYTFIIDKIYFYLHFLPFRIVSIISFFALPIISFSFCSNNFSVSLSTLPSK